MEKKRSLTEETVDSIVDVFEAIKRAFIRRGLIRQKRNGSRSAKRPKKLSEVTSGSHDVLYKADSIFPFTLFPDTIILDREKLTIINRYFFSTSKTTTTPILDVINVEATTGPFFGSIHITLRDMPMDPHSINYLRRSDAMALQCLVEGCVIAREREIDTDHIDRAELIALLKDLGSENSI